MLNPSHGRPYHGQLSLVGPANQLRTACAEPSRPTCDLGQQLTTLSKTQLPVAPSANVSSLHVCTPRQPNPLQTDLRADRTGSTSARQLPFGRNACQSSWNCRSLQARKAGWVSSDAPFGMTAITFHSTPSAGAKLRGVRSCTTFVSLISRLPTLQHSTARPGKQALRSGPGAVMTGMCTQSLDHETFAMRAYFSRCVHGSPLT